MADEAKGVTGPAAGGVMSRSSSVAPPVLSLYGLSKHFGGVRAIDGVSVHIDRGEVVALVGDNGAGKSTLVKCIAGAYEPDSGRIEVEGKEVSLHHPSEARALGIEAVFQELALADHLDVVANMFLGRELWRRAGPFKVLDNRKMRARAQEIIDNFSINIPSLRSSVRTLSGGQRQGVAIGRAVGWGSKLVIMDEPTAALGVRETARIESLVSSLGDQGLAVLLVSHNLEQVFKITDRICVLRRGRLAGERRTADSSPQEVVGMITGAIGAEPTG